MSAAPDLRARAEALGQTLPPLLAEAEMLAATVMLGEHGRRRAGLGDEFWQYRPAHQGDSARMIDWRRSARSDAHFVREREWQAAQSVTLLEAISEFGFDAAIGGARRDEEKARAKERVFSVRDEFGQWDPRNQRPELWNLYNARVNPGQHVRVFPISNWTELDVWQYIARERLEVPSIYFAHRRPVVLEHRDQVEADQVRDLLLVAPRALGADLRRQRLGRLELGRLHRDRDRVSGKANGPVAEEIRRPVGRPRT